MTKDEIHPQYLQNILRFKHFLTLIFRNEDEVEITSILHYEQILKN